MSNVKKIELENIRNSNIELLKVIAIFLVVISHVIQTLTLTNNKVAYNDYFLDLFHASADVKVVILMIMRHFGALGNNIFFVCSAWFLLDKEKSSYKKIFNLITEIWIVSVTIMIITLVFTRRVSFDLIVKSFFPTTFANNWYMTCYILFCLVYPFFNKIIFSMSKEQLLRVTSVLAFLYIGCDFLKEDLFFSNELIQWSAVYFVIAYIKLFCQKTYANNKVNLLALAIGIFGMIGIILFTDILGLRISVFSNRVMRWNTNCNPFMILIAVASFGLARSRNFQNKIINEISKQSLLIYIIHENIFVRTYIRPFVWQWIYTEFGYEKILLWTILYAVCLFFIALIISEIYKKTCGRVAPRLSQTIMWTVKKMYNIYKKKILQIS